MEQRNVVIITAVLVVVALITGWAIYYGGRREITPAPTATTEGVPTTAESETLPRLDTNVSLAVEPYANGTYTVEITPEQPLNLSAVSVRVIVKADGGVQIRPDDVVITPNSDLVNDNWTYPVQQVTETYDAGSVQVDVALLNLNPEVADSVSTGTQIFSFTVEGADENTLSFSIDDTETHVITKESKEANVQFVVSGQ